MRRTPAEERADRIEREAWARGDRRERCAEAAHLRCQGCGVCACTTADLLVSVEYPDGKVDIRTNRRTGETLCVECRYQIREGLR